MRHPATQTVEVAWSMASLTAPKYSAPLTKNAARLLDRCGAKADVRRLPMVLSIASAHSRAILSRSRPSVRSFKLPTLTSQPSTTTLCDEHSNSTNRAASLSASLASYTARKRGFATTHLLLPSTKHQPSFADGPSSSSKVVVETPKSSLTAESAQHFSDATTRLKYLARCLPRSSASASPRHVRRHVLGGGVGKGTSTFAHAAKTEAQSE
mmetsp:Transcript_10874/g.32108  ORF Transcript_10874/g.32108 Transcript_10874/m.32108 type:complete len:211 (-) Transcript_10874:451-1083(-)